jgi:hypothetical protein
MVVCGLTNGGDTNGSGHTSKSKVLQQDLHSSGSRRLTTMEEPQTTRAINTEHSPMRK